MHTYYVSRPKCQSVKRDNVNVSNALMLHNVQRIDVFSSPGENVPSQQLDPTNHLAVNFRLLVW